MKSYTQNLDASFERMRKEKKGVAGMDIMKQLMVGIFVLVMVAFVIVLLADKMMTKTTNVVIINMFNETIQAVADNTSSNFDMWLFFGAIIVIVVLAFFMIRYMTSQTNTGGNMGA